MSDDKRYKIIIWIVASVLSIGVFCLCLFTKGEITIVTWCDACFYTAGIVLCLFLLSLVARLGAFDLLRYGVSDVIYHMRPNAGEKKYKDYVEYTTVKKEQRSKTKVFFWPWLLYIGLAVVAFLVLRFGFYPK